MTVTTSLQNFMVTVNVFNTRWHFCHIVVMQMLFTRARTPLTAGYSYSRILEKYIMQYE